MVTSFRKTRVIAPLHTAGPIAVTHDARKIITCVQEDVLLTDVETGVEICRFLGDTTSITSLCISPVSKHIIIFTSSNSLRVYDLPSTSDPILKPPTPVRHIARSHDAPVHVCTVDPTSSYLASGSADGIVKVWDLRRGYVTHIFKGHGGVVSALAFHHRSAQEVGETSTLKLFTGSVDNHIRVFDLAAPRARSGALKPDAVLVGHVSVPRGIAVSSDGRWLVSGGRDAVVLVWDLANNKSKRATPALVKTIPIFERVEALGILDAEEPTTSSQRTPLKFYTGGEQGIVKIWDAWEGEVVANMGSQHVHEISEEHDAQEQHEIIDVLYVPAAHLIISLHVDQNVLFHSLLTHTLTRQLIGFNDEITDATFLRTVSSHHDTHLALATNSSLIRVYSTETHDASLLSSHTGIVLTLDKGADGRVLASGSKDYTARIWAHSSTTLSNQSTRWGCVAVCEGHAESVGATALSRTGGTGGHVGLRFLFTGSQDRTIKMWDLSSVPLDLVSSSHGMIPEPVRPNSLTTHHAHDKDINSLDVASNDRLLASGSQDKTAKVFGIEYIVSGNGNIRGQIQLLGVCKGHKRGVWNVRFGRTDRVLATASGDKTVKLWSLDDFTCLKTFEGHTNSVLRINFINQGQQLLSSASDGLVKLWNVQTEECTATMDNHEDKIWALAVGSDESTIVTGGADSVVTFWHDSTDEIERETETKREQLALREQDFANYISVHDYHNAILLALAMDRPGRLLSLFRSVRAAAEDKPTASKAITGHPAVDHVLKTLPLPSLAKLLTHVRIWNASAQTSSIAQTLLHAVLKLRPTEDIAAAFEGASFDKNSEVTSQKDGTSLQDLIEGILPYTQRHLARVEKLVQESWVVDFVLGEMDDGLLEEAQHLNVDRVPVE